MASKTTAAPKGSSVLRRSILGSRRPSNYFWAAAVTVGGLGFLLAGISSYTQINLLPFSEPTKLTFLPQGLVMGLYGTAALVLASYLWTVISLDVGGGFNEFSKDSGRATIFRWGYPGKNRKVEVSYALDQILAVRVDIKEGLNPKRALYLKVKGKGDIPLTRVGQPLPLAELEVEGAQLAQFLNVPLEGL